MWNLESVASLMLSSPSWVLKAAVYTFFFLRAESSYLKEHFVVLTQGRVHYWIVCLEQTLWRWMHSREGMISFDSILKTRLLIWELSIGLRPQRYLACKMCWYRALHTCNGLRGHRWKRARRGFSFFHYHFWFSVCDIDSVYLNHVLFFSFSQPRMILHLRNKVLFSLLLSRISSWSTCKFVVET